MFEIIQTDNAPKAVGPYSQAVVSGGFVFCSGQIGLEPKSGNLADGVEAQTKQVLQNIDAVLAEAEVEINQVVKTTIYLKNISDFAVVNEIYGKFFGDHRPARSTVEVSNLPKGALVEIEVIASQN
ncbi:MAG: RidA family protein [Patescibacteria group bacterium]|jgi:2-iminobutanoate/2-iminopropanoate deaminase